MSPERVRPTGSGAANGWGAAISSWLVETGDRIVSTEGVEIAIFELRHEDDDEVLSAWAEHFRGHYCLDSEIDALREGTGFSREEYLNEIKFPSRSDLGPAIRSGDFAEILVADYLEFLSGYWVPRTRYADKTVRDESPKGCDIIGFSFLTPGEASPEDELAIFEAKAGLSATTPVARLQDAVNDSKKDLLRRAESLNAIKQRLARSGQQDEVAKVSRFQNPVDKPHLTTYGAAAVLSREGFDPTVIADTTTASHPSVETLALLVIQGSSLMNLVHQLYGRAASEA